VVLLVVLSTLLYATCAYPSISPTFQAKVSVSISSYFQGNDTGKGTWASDEMAQSTVENYVFDKATFDDYVLDRYDLGTLYRIFAVNTAQCDQWPVDDKMPNPWAWLEAAVFVGKQTFNEKQVDVWEFGATYATRQLAVWSATPSIPAWMNTKSSQRVTWLQFDSWSTSRPPSSLFDVPAICKIRPVRPAKPSNLTCVEQAAIMQRAEVWVQNKVPYNINGRYLNYREDCSGYVSYTWQSGAPGLSTSVFHTMAHPITKAELLPGDCMLNAAEHVCLFGGWTDAAKTHYNAYEETQPCSTNPNWCGTRLDNTVYPYYLDPTKFLPYRFNSRC